MRYCTRCGGPLKEHMRGILGEKVCQITLVAVTASGKLVQGDQAESVVRACWGQRTRQNRARLVRDTNLKRVMAGGR